MRTPSWRPVMAGLAACLWVGGTAIFGLREHWDTLRLAFSLSPLPMESRREELFGPWYVEARRVAAHIARDASVDFVMEAPQTRDIAVLAGPMFHPRDVRYFDGWEGWRGRKRAIFLHDQRAANAPPGPPPARPNVVVLVRTDTPFFTVVDSPE